ncbi:Trihelix transcription factor [Nymphaea thermarum]|nr:Trihelix transcription factor [Nymphaea thermarum]
MQPGHVVDADEAGCSRERQHRHHHLADDDLSLGDDGLDRRWPREEVVGAKSPMDSVRGPGHRPHIPGRKLSGFGHNEENGQAPDTKRYRKGEENELPPESKNSCSTSYRLFNELELILSRELQAGSVSALTGDNNPPPPAGNPSSAAETAGPHVDLASETSPDEEGSLRKMQQLEVQQLEQQQQRKKKRKRKQQQQLGSIAAFFEKLVNQLMEHQEALHRKFMEVMEKRDQERQRREEEWRRQEAARLTKERALRSQEEAAASSREAAILSFLEKFANEVANLPAKRPDVTISQNEASTQPETTSETNRESGENRRWPKSEVNALIKVRGRLEGKFREPGLKGPLWEEVSSAMAAMGYARSAKRCKEKWENINKYFRKTKDSTKKRSKQSKTCPYFHQLDLLYSNKAVASAAAAAGAPTNTELLDAMLAAGGSRKEEIGAATGRSLMGNGENDNEEGGNEEEDDEDVEEEDVVEDDDEEEKEKQQHDERKRGKRKEREGEAEGEE